jgi:multiple sugar transport system substrate-binding protein
VVKERQSFKKILILLAMLFMLSGPAAGCSGGQTGSGQAGSRTDAMNGSTVADSAAKIKLTFLFYYEGQERFAIVNNLCNGFNEAQRNIEVVPEFVPFEELKKRLITGFAEGRPPDVVLFDKPDQAYLAEKGILADITDQIDAWPDKNRYYENSIASCTYRGRIYGMPIGENCLGLFYNKTLFERYRVTVPKTWEELKDTAQKLSAGHAKGIGISAQDSEQGLFQFLPWFYSAGASLDSFDSPESIKAIAFLTGLIQDGSMSEEIINWSQADLVRQFVNGNIAMMLNGPWQLSDIRAKAPNLDYSVAEIPRDRKTATVLGGENIGIVNGADKDAAFQFLVYLCDVENVKTFSRAMGYFPARRDVSVFEVFEDNPATRYFERAMRYASTRGPDPGWPEISKTVTRALREAFTGVKPPEAAAREAQASLEARSGR